MEPQITPEPVRTVRLKQLLDHIAVRWLVVIVWMALIFIFSAQSQLPSLADYDVWYKKTAHFCAYGVLALLAQRAFAPRSHTVWWAWLLAVGYAISDEWHQSFVPGRHPAATDVLIDAAGACTLLLLHALQRVWRMHHPPIARKP